MTDVNSLFCWRFSRHHKVCLWGYIIYSHTFSLIGSCFIHDGFVYVNMPNGESEWMERERERERICIHNFHFEYCCINRANNILLHALDSSFISFKVVSLCHVDNQVDIMTLLYIVIIWNTLLFHLKINVHCSCIINKIPNSKSFSLPSLSKKLIMKYTQ